MKWKICAITTALAGLLAGSGLSSDGPARRPHIFGLVTVEFYSSKPALADVFYTRVLGIHYGDCELCQKLPMPFFVDGTQKIQLVSASAAAPTNLLAEIMFATDDTPALRRYFQEQKIQIIEPSAGEKRAKGYLAVLDPEGHRIGFTQNVKVQDVKDLDEHIRPSMSTHIIHAGFVVHDRAAADHFYKDILGFRPYWHGGMKDDKDDWVAMQVPDGTDWVEYMLNISPTADKHTLGVMNHIALGVTDIQAAKAQLIKNGVTLTEEPKLGRDGKWQLNLYDPDETRIEFMEFTPKEKPCCSAFTGPHPRPQK